MFTLSSVDNNNRILEASLSTDEQTLVRNLSATEIPILIDLQRRRLLEMALYPHFTNDSRHPV